MDIKAKIDEIVNKVKNDPKLMDKLQSDPAAVIKEITGIELPTDQLGPVVDTIKAKVGLDGIANLLGGLTGKK